MQFAVNPTTPPASFRITGPHLRQSAVVNDILRALPDWFGIEESIVNYVKEMDDLPVFLALDVNPGTGGTRGTDGTGETGRAAGAGVLGFLSIKQHFDHAAEIHLIAVRAEHHRAGLGRALLLAVEDWLRARSVEFLQVKTLSPSRECEHYARTRKFYEAMGFRALEEFSTLWGERNPCLVMIKSIV